MSGYSSAKASGSVPATARTIVYSSPMFIGAVSVVAQVWIPLADLVQQILQLVPLGEGVESGAILRGQSRVTPF